MNLFHAYKILGGHPGMTQEELKALHRALVNKAHPDRVGGYLPRFLEIQGAWELVRDTEARRNLRIRLQGLGTECPACLGKGVILKQKKFVTVSKSACETCGACGYLPRPPK